MKTLLSIILFTMTLLSQQDSFYMGLGIVNSTLNGKTENLKLYDKEFSNNPYFFLGYDVTAYEKGIFRFSTHFGATYMTLENEYAQQRDKYNLIIFNLIPKASFSLSNEFAIQVKLHSDIKLFEFFANIDGSSEVRDRLLYFEEFNTMQFAYEAGFKFSPEWLHQYSLEITYISHLSKLFDNSSFSIKMSPTYQITIYTLL